MLSLNYKLICFSLGEYLPLHHHLIDLKPLIVNLHERCYDFRQNVLERKE